MALKIPREDETSEKDSFTFSHFETGETNYFVLKNDDQSNEEIRIVFPFNITQIPEGYTVSVFTFKNQHYSQNDLLEIRVNEKATQSGRIGYTFSSRALVDKENNIFNIHTLPFAYYTFISLISATTSIEPIVPSKKLPIYDLLDFYADDLVFAVLCDQLTQEIDEFSFDDYLYVLYLHGFIYLDDVKKIISFNNISFIKQNYESIKSIPENFRNGRYSWKIKSAERFLRAEIYPSTLIKKLITEQHYFLSKFHILYQVIEILIADVLKTEITLTVTGDTENLSGFKLKKILSKLATEGYRIARLFNDYSTISIGFDEEMILKLQEFFSEIKLHLPSDDDEDEGNSNKLSSLVYKHRNNLVHNYRIIHKDTARLDTYINQLIEINSYFEFLVFQLLHTYKKAPDLPKNVVEPGMDIESIIPSGPAITEVQHAAAATEKPPQLN